MKINNCLICSSESNLFLIKDELPYFKCSNCDLIFADPKSYDEFNKEFYNNKFYSDNEDEWSKEERLNLFKIILDIAIKESTSKLNIIKPSIIDFGAGIKDLAEKKEMYKKLTFFDEFFSSPYLSKKEEIQGKTFDAMICTEVVEHVFDQHNLFKEISSFLKPNKSCFATTLLHDHNFVLNYLNPSVGHVCLHSKKSMAIVTYEYGLEHKIIPMPGLEYSHYFHVFTKK